SRRVLSGRRRRVPIRGRAWGLVGECSSESSFLLLQVFEVIVQLIEAAFPVRALRNHPLLRLLQRLRRELIGSYPSRLSRPNQTAVLQHVQVLGERRQRHLERLRQLAHRGRTAAQSFKHSPSGWVREGLKDTIERDGLVRHLPHYTAA